jgi:hypothetical protein
MRFGVAAIILLAWFTAVPSFAREEGAAASPEGRAAPRYRESGPVSFVGEEISLAITGGRVTVTGRYRLHSSLPGKHAVPLAYPFPVGAKADYPDTIRVFQGKELVPVKFDEDRKQAAAFFRIEAEGDFEFTAVYSQRLRAREATYILTTTREWGVPLQTAEFRVTLPNNLTPTYWSWPPDRTERKNGFTTYRIHRANFFPDRDLTVRWKPRKGR